MAVTNRTIFLTFSERFLDLAAPPAIIAGSSFRLSAAEVDFDGVTALDATTNEIILIDAKLNQQLDVITPAVGIAHDGTGLYHVDLQTELWAAEGDWLIRWIATFPDGKITINDLILTVIPASGQVGGITPSALSSASIIETAGASSAAILNSQSAGSIVISLNRSTTGRLKVFWCVVGSNPDATNDATVVLQEDGITIDTLAIPAASKASSIKEIDRSPSVASHTYRIYVLTAVTPLLLIGAIGISEATP